MRDEEKRFHITKNKLDNEYSEFLTYLQIAMVVAATAVISVDIYFISKNDISSAARFSSIFVVIAVIFFAYIKFRLDEIKQKINEL